MAVAGVDPKPYEVEIYIYNKNLPVEFFSRSACSGQSVDCVEAIAKKNI
jgi:hypothetical protein